MRAQIKRLHVDQRFLDRYGFGDGFRTGDIAEAVVRSHAFNVSPSIAFEVLNGFPLVNEGYVPWFLDDFEASGGIDGRADATPAIVVLFDAAMSVVAADDRVAATSLIARLPETNDGLRSFLINAQYYEFATYMDAWINPDRAGGATSKGNNWAFAANWASIGAGDKIRGEFPTLFSLAPPTLLADISQTFADGNQWIFADMAPKYAALIELLEVNSNPSAGQWESFFNDSELFVTGDEFIRDGFLAMVAARYEPDVARAQELVLQSTMLFLTHEQRGAQPYLDELDYVLIPESLAGRYATVELGRGRELNTHTDIDDDLSIDLDNPTPYLEFGDNLIWSENVLDLDPDGASRSMVFDAPGFDVTLGGIASAASVDINDLVDPNPDPAALPTKWSDWRTAGATEGGVVCSSSVYCATYATEWWDYEERMWYLLNLFRVLNVDGLIAALPVEAAFDDPRFGVYEVATIEKLRAP